MLDFIKFNWRILIFALNNFSIVSKTIAQMSVVVIMLDAKTAPATARAVTKEIH